MSVSIRLQRHGAKARPYYKVVVTDSRNTRDGRFIERIGSYDPVPSKEFIDINRERYDHWVKNGAIASDTVRNLVKKAANLNN